MTKLRDGKQNKVSVDVLTILLYIDTASEILPGPGAYTTNPAPGGIHRRESIMPRGKSWPSRNFNPDPGNVSSGIRGTCQNAERNC